VPGQKTLPSGVAPTVTRTLAILAVVLLAHAYQRAREPMSRGDLSSGRAQRLPQ